MVWFKVIFLIEILFINGRLRVLLIWIWYWLFFLLYFGMLKMFIWIWLLVFNVYFFEFNKGIFSLGINIGFGGRGNRGGCVFLFLG